MKPPLSALLSHALIAFTIELDNEFEHQMPHRTSRFGATAPNAPWLVSVAMWWNCMRFVGDDGVAVRELIELARTTTNLRGMHRWGYIAVEPNGRHPRDWIVRATPAGREARQIWARLIREIEQRWELRFGPTTIENLRAALWTLIEKTAVDLPDCLPILAYGLFSHALERPMQPQPRPPLPALLSRVLLKLALEFEKQSEISLAIAANVLRILDTDELRVKDLPSLAGVSREAIGMALGFLRKKRMVAIAPGNRVKLTESGREAKEKCRRLLIAIERRWERQFGATVEDLRSQLEDLHFSPLSPGLDPYPDGWRSKVPKPESLPHFPMVLHRGGFPDGS